MNIVDFIDGEVILKIKHKAFIDLRKKSFSVTSSYYKEMFYVYNVSDYNAPPARGGFDEVETHKYAVEAAGLKEDFIPDQKVLRAIEAYYSLRDTSVIHYLKELYKSMNIGSRTVKVLNEINTELLNQVNDIKTKTKEDLVSKSELTSTIANNLSTLFEMANKSQGYVDKLKDLIEKAKVEEERLEKGLGDTDITSSMIPDEY